MAYTHINFPTKKALREAVVAGRRVTVYAPGIGEIPENGRSVLKARTIPSLIAGVLK